MNRKLILCAFLGASVVLSGCIGGKSVELSYLRVGHNLGCGPGCEKVKSGVPRLALKRFTSLPSLDRETVIIANGPVLKPDYRWNWEGTPAEVFDQAAGPALGCMNSYEVVTPYRPGLERSLVLSGEITSFELQRDGGDRFIASVRFSLWDSEGRVLLARRKITSEAPVGTMDGHGIATAAQQAVGKVLDDAVQWIDGLGEGGLLPGDKR
ncbi:hypothetical protein [Maridesulfovibrio sp. FT414]|uniref:hypothetical protein n=1 Tax=Maridesulfovibrio sp. FT414 TaxID=2979469 RepID=UPI003D807FD2